MNKVYVELKNVADEYNKVLANKQWLGIWSEIRDHGKNFLENNSWPSKNTPFWNHTSIQKFVSEKSKFENVKIKLTTKPNVNLDIFSFFDLAKDSKASERLFSILASTRNLAAPAHLDLLDALNTMLTEDGFLIYVHENSQISEPVNLELVTRPNDSGEEKISQCKIYVIVDDGSNLTINLQLRSESSVTLNVGSELVLNPKANVSLNQVISSAQSAKINVSTKIYLHNNSEFNLNNIYLNEGFVRTFHQIYHLEQQAKSNIYSSSLGLKNSHLDQQILLDHVSGEGKSVQQFRNMSADKSKSIVSGKVKIRPQAQKVDSEQLFKTLSLSDQSTNLAEPQLEIYADDVKATHGNTCGDIRDEEIFYLQSRGINKSKAKQMLSYAFLEETVLQINDINFKKLIHEELNQKLQSVLKDDLQ